MPGPTDELIRLAARVGGPAGATDRDLLARFAAGRDEAAFAELVRRHGPGVFGVCRRVAGHCHDAEDAFQATFLVLARRAGQIARPESLGGWLYGVAVRVARKARRAADRRRRRESPTDPLPESPTEADDRCPEFAGIVDEELAALPAWYRDAVVLCDLRGQSRTEAAGALGIPEGTLSSRLNAGRKKLAARLTRRGLGVPAAGLATILSADATAVPPNLAASAVTRAVGGVVPANILHLAAEGGWGVSRVKLAAAVVVAVGVGIGTVAAWSGEKSADRPAAAEPKANPVVAPEPTPNKQGEEPAPKQKVRVLNRASLPTGEASLGPWSRDGRFGTVRSEQKDEKSGTSKRQIAIFDRELGEPLVSASDGNSLSVVGFLPNEPVCILYRSSRGLINEDNQLWHWRLLRQDERKDASRIELVRRTDIDLEDGTPIAITGDGKSVLCVSPRDRQEEALPNVLSLTDLRSGDRVREVARMPGYLKSIALSADGKNVFTVRYGKERLAVESWATDGSGVKWSKTFAYDAKTHPPQAPDGMTFSSHDVLPSPDGMTVFVLFGSGATADDPKKHSYKPGTIGVFDTGTGEDRNWPTANTLFDATMSISHDSRLLVGRRTTAPGRASLDIWDVRTGRPVKSWPITNMASAEASFAPDRLTLALVETTYREVPIQLPPVQGFGGVGGAGGLGGGIGSSPTEPDKSVLALWDMSALQK